MFSHFMSVYTQMGLRESDTPEEIIKKRMLSFLPLIIGIAAIIWGFVFILLGHYIAGAIPLSYAVISSINLWHFFTTKKIWFLQVSQLLLVLFLPFFLMWSLGGFAGGSFMLIWAFYAPVAAMAFETKKTSGWIITFVILVCISALLDSTLIHNVSHLPEIWITIFFVLNSIVGFGGIYFMFHYYITDKEARSREAIFIEHQSLLKKSAELAEANLKLEQIATHDNLTGLANRLNLLDNLENSIQYAMDHDQKLALFFIDLDRFKQINDTLGHPIGDKVLIHISNLLRDKVDGTNLVSRLGGDEFVILFDAFKDIDELSLLAANIIDATSQIIHLEKQELHLTCSIGISIYPDDIESSPELTRSNLADILLRNADTAMYRAKEDGKNNFQFYQINMTARAMERMMMEQNLRDALHNDQFIVYFQPQIDVLYHTIVGMEALVRWQHPQQGFIVPNNFIPLAEDVGLIVLIDRIVMRKALKEFAQWYAEGLNPGVLSLNLSVRQLEQEDFIEKLSQIIQEMGAQTSWIELEVTEGYIMRDPEKAIRALQALHKMGIRISIDDFGTGYSSLSYLKRLPIDKLKVDKSFIDGLPQDENDVSITKAIIGLANSMNLSIIAEGVETKAQKDFLMTHGCHLVQGYLYAKPVPAELMKKYLINPYQTILKKENL